MNITVAKLHAQAKTYLEFQNLIFIDNSVLFQEMYHYRLEKVKGDDVEIDPWHHAIADSDGRLTAILSAYLLRWIEHYFTCVHPFRQYYAMRTPADAVRENKKYTYNTSDDWIQAAREEIEQQTTSNIELYPGAEKTQFVKGWDLLDDMEQILPSLVVLPDKYPNNLCVADPSDTTLTDDSRTPLARGGTPPYPEWDTHTMC